MMKLDSNSCVINPWKKEKINREFLPLIKKGVDDLMQHFQSRVLAIYVRGSVSSGHAVYGHSDLDMVCILRNDVSHSDELWDRDECTLLGKMFPEISFIDLTLVSENEVEHAPHFALLRVNLQSQSCLFYGEDIRPRLPKIPIWPQMFRYLYRGLPSYLKELQRYFSEEGRTFYYLGKKRSTKVICKWIMRVILRSSLGLVMLQKKIYTPNVQICYKEFIALYPTYTKDMEQILQWEYFPISDKKKINAFLTTFFRKYLPLYRKALQQK